MSEGDGSAVAARPRKGADFSRDIWIPRELLARGDYEYHYTNTMWRACEACGGPGVYRNRTCDRCEGRGRYDTDVDSLLVKIPRDVRAGKKIRLPRKGYPGTNGGERGDLYLVVCFTGEGEIRDELPPSPPPRVSGSSIQNLPPARPLNNRLGK